MIVLYIYILYISTLLFALAAKRTGRRLYPQKANFLLTTLPLNPIETFNIVIVVTDVGCAAMGKWDGRTRTRGELLCVCGFTMNPSTLRPARFSVTLCSQPLFVLVAATVHQRFPVRCVTQVMNCQGGLVKGREVYVYKYRVPDSNEAK